MIILRLFIVLIYGNSSNQNRGQGSNEGPIKFLSKPQNKKALDLLKKGYKNIEVAKITGLHVNTITKVKRHL